MLSFVTLHFCLFAVCVAKVFERCELAQLLRYRHGFDKNQVANWVCIAEHSSSLNSSAYAGSLKSGSHGLFQINDQFWCSPPGKGFACDIECEKLRDDDLTDDLDCVRQIFMEHERIAGDGYTAWNAYEQFCSADRSDEYIEGCFKDDSQTNLVNKHNHHDFPLKDYTSNSITELTSEKRRKIYDRCELAQELRFKHKMPMEEIPTWVCIAQHESRFDTSAVGRLNADGSGDHGLFQISDLYWCSIGGEKGKACNIPCSKLEDSDISDDVKCVRKIYAEHTGISGDGFTAWTVYDRHCRKQRREHISGCFKEKDLGDSNDLSTMYRQNQFTNFSSFNARKGKVYGRCELAKELHFKHRMPMEEIATWVCIAQHESSFDTSAVGRLNSDGSGDHGLFQISDLYWCTIGNERGKGCNILCSKLEDSDISDDVECAKKIYAEHTEISGDGFTAWAVYDYHCRNQKFQQISNCFEGHVTRNKLNKEYNEIQRIPSYRAASSKIYEPCELADELRTKHHIPEEQIANWVCIAKYESNFNTAAVGDGAHGMFQITDMFWCSRHGKGKACNLKCSDLKDADLTDDIQCMKKIYAEHQELSGNGFNAWAVYPTRCSNGRSRKYVEQCRGSRQPKGFSFRDIETPPPKSETFHNNPFLNSFAKLEQKKPETSTTSPYNGNPFFQKYNQQTTTKPTTASTHFYNQLTTSKSQNPFLSHLTVPTKSSTKNYFFTTTPPTQFFTNKFFQFTTTTSKPTKVYSNPFKLTTATTKNPFGGNFHSTTAKTTTKSNYQQFSSFTKVATKNPFTGFFTTTKSTKQQSAFKTATTTTANPFKFNQTRKPSTTKKSISTPGFSFNFKSTTPTSKNKQLTTTKSSDPFTHPFFEKFQFKSDTKTTPKTTVSSKKDFFSSTKKPTTFATTSSYGRTTQKPERTTNIFDFYFNLYKIKPKTN